MPQSSQLRFPRFLDALTRNGPIRRKYKFRFWEQAFQFPQRCPQRNVIAAVSIEQKNLFRAKIHNRTAKLDHELDVWHLLDTQRSRKKKMMRRMSRPQRWQAENLLSPFFFNPSRDRRHDIRVRREGQMMPVLLERPEREDYHLVRQLKFLNFRPRQIFQQHPISKAET